MFQNIGIEIKKLFYSSKQWQWYFENMIGESRDVSDERWIFKFKNIYAKFNNCL